MINFKHELLSIIQTIKQQETIKIPAFIHSVFACPVTFSIFDALCEDGDSTTPKIHTTFCKISTKSMK